MRILRFPVSGRMMLRLACTSAIFFALNSLAKLKEVEDIVSPFNAICHTSSRRRCCGLNINKLSKA